MACATRIKKMQAAPGRGVRCQPLYTQLVGSMRACFKATCDKIYSIMGRTTAASGVFVVVLGG